MRVERVKNTNNMDVEERYWDRMMKMRIYLGVESEYSNGGEDYE